LAARILDQGLRPELGEAFEAFCGVVKWKAEVIESTCRASKSKVVARYDRFSRVG
jgi:hypothetical protein